jgi:hypothetical protein
MLRLVVVGMFSLPQSRAGQRAAPETKALSGPKQAEATTMLMLMLLRKEQRPVLAASSAREQKRAPVLPAAAAPPQFAGPQHARGSVLQRDRAGLPRPGAIAVQTLPAGHGARGSPGPQRRPRRRRLPPQTLPAHTPRAAAAWARAWGRRTARGAGGRGCRPGCCGQGRARRGGPATAAARQTWSRPRSRSPQTGQAAQAGPVSAWAPPAARNEAERPTGW